MACGTRAEFKVDALLANTGHPNRLSAFRRQLASSWTAALIAAKRWRP